MITDLLRLFGTLLLVFGGLGVAVWLTRRWRDVSPSPLKVVCRVPIAKQATLAIVSAGSRRLLVGTGERGVTLLAELSADEIDPLLDTADAPGYLAGDRTNALGPVPGVSPWTGLLRKIQLMTVRQAGRGSYRGSRR